jgi:hypothetical protein
MVARYVSDPIELPRREEGAAEYARADLAFYGVDHSGSSYEARLFIDAEADVDTPRDHPNYAGAFHVFGHGGCFGDEGHCDVPQEPPDPFDVRPPHQLTPITKTVIVTDALRRLVHNGQESIRVTVVAETPGDRSNEVLHFDTVRLLTYE